MEEIKLIYVIVLYKNNLNVKVSDILVRIPSRHYVFTRYINLGHCDIESNDTPLLE